MKHITINGQNRGEELNRNVDLRNGSLVLLKDGIKTKSVFMVVSFRDNTDRYKGDSTGGYCTLLDLDTGYYQFEERCSRNTTVRRVINHILNLGRASYKYNESIPAESYCDYDIEVVPVGKYGIDLKL